MKECKVFDITPGLSCLNLAFVNNILLLNCMKRKGEISCSWNDGRGRLCFTCSLKIIIMSQQKCVTKC